MEQNAYKGISCKDGDVITLILDLSKAQLSFEKNGTFVGVAFDDIEDGDYKLAVCIFGKKNKIFRK